jgi:hypothetical protein
MLSQVSFLLVFIFLLQFIIHFHFHFQRNLHAFCIRYDMMIQSSHFILADSLICVIFRRVTDFNEIAHHFLDGHHLCNLRFTCISDKIAKFYV